MPSRFTMMMAASAVWGRHRKSLDRLEGRRRLSVTHLRERPEDEPDGHHHQQHHEGRQQPGDLHTQAVTVTTARWGGVTTH